MFLVALLVVGLGLVFLPGSERDSGLGDNSPAAFSPEGLRITVPNLSQPTVVTLTSAEVTTDTNRYVGSFHVEDTGLQGAVAAIDTLRTPLHSDAILMPFAVNYGGSGTFVYLGLFEATEAGYMHIESLGIGDRIEIEDIAVNGQDVTIDYLAHGPQQALAEEPTMPALIGSTVVEGMFTKGYRYLNASADDLVLIEPMPESTVGQTFTVTGRVRGYWYFEADFPIRVFGPEGEIAIAIATAESDWMTESFVPFSAEVTLEESYEGPVLLMLERDNPSGLPENSASFETRILIAN